MDRFREKVNHAGPVPTAHPEAGPCHLWAASVNQRTGYGQFRDGNTVVDAHLWLWRQERGPVPAKHVLDHWACDRHACVNVRHLRPVTARENVLRSESAAAINRAKTRCPQDHPYAGDNVRETNAGRRCRACDRDRKRAAYRGRKRTSQ